MKGEIELSSVSLDGRKERLDGSSTIRSRSRNYSALPIDGRVEPLPELFSARSYKKSSAFSHPRRIGSGLLQNLAYPSNVLTNRSFDIESRSFDIEPRAKQKPVIAISIMVTALMILLLTIASLSKVKRRKKKKSMVQLLNIFKYLLEFNLEDIDMRISPAGGFLIGYKNGLAEGVNEKESTSEDDSRDSQGRFSSALAKAGVEVVSTEGGTNTAFLSRRV
jgi:hypothetical protein